MNAIALQSQWIQSDRRERFASVRLGSPAPEPDPRRDIGLLCNRCVSNCVSICPAYIYNAGAVYTRATDDVSHNARMCAGSARRGAACGVCRALRCVACGTEHVSIRPHNGNITAI